MALPSTATKRTQPKRPRGSVVTLPTTRTKAPPKPFTVAHFRAWAADLALDTGESWHPEDFQEAFAEDLFGGVPECWLLVPEGNGKTTLIAGLALYHIEHKPFAAVPVAASSREQAENVYRQAEGFVLRSERLYQPVHSVIAAAKGKRKTEVPRFLCLEGYRRINHHAGGRIQVFAADDRTGDGVIPTLAIIDEMHRHQDLRLYRTWSGKLAKRGGQLIGISTAGEPGSDFELTREKILETATIVRLGAFVHARTRRVALHEWALPLGAEPDDIAAVKAANPFSGITAEMLAEKFDSPTMTLSHWSRFVCNRPTREVESWLGPDGDSLWTDLAESYEFGDGPVYLGVDVGLKRDSTAVVAVQRDADGLLHAVARFWIPKEREPVDVTDVMQHIRELAKDHDVAAVSYDPRFFDVAAKMLEAEGLPMVEVPQSVERMTTICGDLLALIKTAGIRHEGDEVLTNHVLNAVPRFNERGFTLQKSKSHGRIDGCIALALAVDRANRGEIEQAPQFAWA